MKTKEFQLFCPNKRTCKIMPVNFFFYHLIMTTYVRMIFQSNDILSQCHIDLRNNPIGLYSYTGCSLDIVIFSKILKYSGLLPFSVFPRYQCVNTHQAGRTPALQQSWQSSEKFRNFKEKTQ